MKKIVLIGDIISSKRIKNRNEIQRKLVKLFKKINKGNKGLVSPYTITLGDEFQALYQNADNLFNDVWQIMLDLYPERIRFSIGIGELTTRVNKRQAIGMDGPAFYNARAGLNQLKTTTFMLNLTDNEEGKFTLINQVLFFISSFIKKWKHTRISIFNMLNKELTIKEISLKMKISDKAVYKNIYTGNMFIIMKLFDEITKELNKAIGKK